MCRLNQPLRDATMGQDGNMRESKRVRIFEDPGELVVEIAPYPNRYALIKQFAATVIFAGPAVESERSLAPLIRSGHALLGYCYVGTFAVMALISGRRFLWLLCGHEEIVLRGGLLSVSRRFGVVKTLHTYRVAKVKDIHAALRITTVFSITRGRLGFYYEGKMRYMADRITTKDAKRLVVLFRRWLPKECWTSVLGL
jgi:hypothetical protein